MGIAVSILSGSNRGNGINREPHVESAQLLQDISVTCYRPINQFTDCEFSLVLLVLIVYVDPAVNLAKHENENVSCPAVLYYSEQLAVRVRGAAFSSEIICCGGAKTMYEDILTDAFENLDMTISYHVD
ncbi:hypothetical protein ES703_84435 [subsurface metagenome]